MIFGDFKRIHDINIDFVTFAGCKLTIREFMQSTGINRQDGGNASVAACVKKLHCVSKGSRVYYDMLVTSSLKPKCCSKWEEKLGIEINWDLCFTYLHQIEEVNMKWFQMRIVHRIIGTNVILKEKWEIQAVTDVASVTSKGAVSATYFGIVHAHNNFGGGLYTSHK